MDRSFIIDGMARALWVLAYASWAEDDEGEHDGPFAPPEVASGGDDWFDVVPPTPSASVDPAAEYLADVYEQANGVSLEILASRAAEADGVDAEDLDADEFGIDLVHMALGTGASWFDDHRTFELARVDAEVTFDGHAIHLEAKPRRPVAATRQPGFHRSVMTNPGKHAPGRVTVYFPERFSAEDIDSIRQSGYYGSLMVYRTAKDAASDRLPGDSVFRISIPRSWIREAARRDWWSGVARVPGAQRLQIDDIMASADGDGPWVPLDQVIAFSAFRSNGRPRGRRNPSGPSGPRPLCPVCGAGMTKVGDGEYACACGVTARTEDIADRNDPRDGKPAIVSWKSGHPVRVRPVDAPSTDHGENFVEVVRAALSEASPEFRRALRQRPDALVDVRSERGQRLEWYRDPETNATMPEGGTQVVLVLTEGTALSDSHNPEAWDAYEVAAKAIRSLWFVEDAGWESINAAVNYFWMTPKMIA